MRPGIAVVGVVVADVERVFGKQKRAARDLVVLLQHVLGDRCRRAGVVAHEVIGVELAVLVQGVHRARHGAAEVVLALGERVAHDAVARRGPVERIRAGNAAIDPVAFILDVDGLAGVDEAAVLGAAAEVVGVRIGDALGGCALRDGKRLVLGEHHAVSALERHLARGLLEEQRHGAVGHLEGVLGLVDRRRGLAVLVGRIGLSLDLSRVALGTRRGVGGEVARKVHVVPEDARLEEGDLRRHVVVERDVGDIVVVRILLGCRCIRQRALVVRSHRLIGESRCCKRRVERPSRRERRGQDEAGSPHLPVLGDTVSHDSPFLSKCSRDIGPIPASPRCASSSQGQRRATARPEASSPQPPLLPRIEMADELAQRWRQLSRNASYSNEEVFAPSASGRLPSTNGANWYCFSMQV